MRPGALKPLHWVAVYEREACSNFDAIRQRSKLRRVILEAIADAANRVNQLRMGRVSLDLLTQPANVYIDRAVGAGELAAPHALKQKIARERHAGVVHQASEK